MADPNTVRVLSLDGGGVRGYLSLKFLQRFIQQWGVRANELWKYFDVIAGTSIGGIQALGYAYGKSPEDLEPFFLERAKRMFTIRTVPVGCNADSDSNRPSTAQKILLVLKDEAFYESACAPDEGNSNYGSNILHSTLVENFGADTMQELKTKTLVPAYEEDSKRYRLFSNYKDALFIGDNELIVNVARATSAAPVYLPEHSFNNHNYLDGGLYQNNPTELALSLAKNIKPRANRFCVLSLGTGLGTRGFYGATEEINTENSGEEQDPNTPPSPDGGITRMVSLMDIAMTGGQEAIDYNLKVRANRTLEQLYYYRFQPILDQNINTELDNSDESFLEYMANTANNWFDTEMDKITNFIGHLTA